MGEFCNLREKMKTSILFLCLLLNVALGKKNLVETYDDQDSPSDYYQPPATTTTTRTTQPSGHICHPGADSGCENAVTVTDEGAPSDDCFCGWNGCNYPC